MTQTNFKPKDKQDWVTRISAAAETEEETRGIIEELELTISAKNRGKSWDDKGWFGLDFASGALNVENALNAIDDADLDPEEIQIDCTASFSAAALMEEEDNDFGVTVTTVSESCQISLTKEFWTAHKAQILEILDVEKDEVKTDPYIDDSGNDGFGFIHEIEMVTLYYEGDLDKWHLDAINMIPQFK